MIKVFVGDADVVEVATNQFMEDKGKDFPVRTNIEMVDGKLVYVATVFYDGTKRSVTPNIDSAVNITEEVVNDKPKSDKIGALWKNDKGYSGSVEVDGKTQKLMVSTEAWDNLETVDTKAGHKMKIGTHADGSKFRIIANQYKKESKHPDFVIMRAD